MHERLWQLATAIAALPCKRTRANASLIPVRNLVLVLHAVARGILMIENQKRTLVVSKTPPKRPRPNTSFVATPLDLISVLETERDLIATVVLTGSFAAMRELTTFLVDAYPALRILSGRPGEEPDTYLPAFS